MCLASWNITSVSHDRRSLENRWKRFRLTAGMRSLLDLMVECLLFSSCIAKTLNASRHFLDPIIARTQAFFGVGTSIVCKVPSSRPRGFYDGRKHLIASPGCCLGTASRGLRDWAPFIGIDPCTSREQGKAPERAQCEKGR